MIPNCKCGTDVYWSLWEEKGLLRCWKCGATTKASNYHKEKKEKEYMPVIMPVEAGGFRLNKTFWDDYNPWKNFPLSLTKKFGFYLSFLIGWNNISGPEWHYSFGIHDPYALYLIMPVFKNKNTVSYSARMLAELNSGFGKYVIPKNVKKEYWTSVNPKKFGKKVFISEGIADGAYLSQLGSSIALLGSSYDGSLNEHLEGKEIYVVFDGDIAGKKLVWNVVKALPSSSITRIVQLDKDKDPTDYTLPQLKKKIGEC